MPSVKDQFKSSYGAFRSRERELERNRALHDAREAATSDGAADPGGAASPPTAPPLAGA